MNERYARQLVLAEVGAAGQARLAAASVVVVGAGGSDVRCCNTGRRRLAAIVDHDTSRDHPIASRFAMADITQGGGGATGWRFNPGRSPWSNGSPAERGGPRRLRDRWSMPPTASVLHPERCLPRANRWSASVIGLAMPAPSWRRPSYRAVFPDVLVESGTCAAFWHRGRRAGPAATLRCILPLELACWPRVTSSQAARLRRFRLRRQPRARAIRALHRARRGDGGRSRGRSAQP
jgi:hypothetical protein